LQTEKPGLFAEWFSLAAASTQHFQNHLRISFLATILPGSDASQMPKANLFRFCDKQDRASQPFRISGTALFQLPTSALLSVSVTALEPASGDR
jgi:hypothetical protein